MRSDRLSLKQQKQGGKGKYTTQKKGQPTAAPAAASVSQLQGILANSSLPLTPSSISIAQQALGNQATAQFVKSRMQTNDPLQRMEIPEDEELQMKRETVQREEFPEEEELQMKRLTAQRLHSHTEYAAQQHTVQHKENSTGMPDQLKAGVESLSGMDLSDVKVHYNSDKPAQLNALAYAQGNDIHVGPGQEKHLPHEAWHVVQQRQGRVKPTMQMKEGIPINDDAGLEKEADIMGAEALKDGDLES